MDGPGTSIRCRHCKIKVSSLKAAYEHSKGVHPDDNFIICRPVGLHDKTGKTKYHSVDFKIKPTEDSSSFVFTNVDFTLSLKDQESHPKDPKDASTYKVQKGEDDGKTLEELQHLLPRVAEVLEENSDLDMWLEFFF